MNDPLDEWLIISSKSGKDANGFPLGEKLCKCSDLQRLLNELNIKDVMIRPYIPEYKFSMTMDEIQIMQFCLIHSSSHLMLSRSEERIICSIQEKLKNLEM